MTPAVLRGLELGAGWAIAAFWGDRAHWFVVEPTEPRIGFTKTGNVQLLQAFATPACEPAVRRGISNKVPLLPPGQKYCQRCVRIREKAKAA